MYSVKAVSKATGISPETLRAWERRYGAVKPVREANGRRAYSHDDVTRLRQLKTLSELGHAISRLASLTQPELDALCAENSTPPRGAGTGDLVNRLLIATTNADDAACDEVLAQAMCVLPPRRLVGEVLSPALVEAGERWHAGELSIGQEHLLSTRIRRLLMSLINTYQCSSSPHRVIFATHSGEMHTFGSLFAAYIAASLGTRAIYLDYHLPSIELDRLAREMEAHAVALSLVNTNNEAQAIDQVEQLSTLANGDYEIWTGGACAAKLAAEGRLPAVCRHVGSLDELEACLTLPAAS